MDAKMACDKLNGFNFQNRYLVGRIAPSHLSAIIANINSAVSSTRQDGQVERGPRIPQGEFRTAEEAARYRITNRRACGSDSDDKCTTTTSKRSNQQILKKAFCRPVYACVQQEGQCRCYWYEGQNGENGARASTEYCYYNYSHYSFFL